MRGRGKRVYLAAEEPAIVTYEWAGERAPG